MDEQPEVQWRPRAVRLVLGIAVLGLALLLLQEAATIHERARWVSVIWLGTLIVAALASPILIGNGLGLFSSELLASSGSGRVPSARQWIAVYCGSIIAIVSLSFFLNWVAGVHLLRAGFWACAALFLLASLGRPWWLYATVRRTGWFAFVKGDRALRIILWVIAAVLVTLGFLAPTIE